MRPDRAFLLRLLRRDSEPRALLQGLVDRHSRLCAFGSGDNGKLDIVRGVAGYVESRHLGPSEVVGFYTSVPRERASQLAWQIELWMLARCEEDSVAGDPIAGGQNEMMDVPVGMLQRRDRCFTDLDTLLRQLLTMNRTEARRPVRAEGHAIAPCLEHKRQCGRLPALAVQLARARVARRTGVTEQHAPPATPKDERRAEPRWSTAHDHGVVHM